MVKYSLRGALYIAVVSSITQQVSATFLTLSSVEFITYIPAPLGCILAYNTPIFTCNTLEFTKGSSTCSNQCKYTLQNIQRNVQSACSSVSAPRGSLIFQAQQGTLVSVFCNDGNSQPLPPPRPSSTRELSTRESRTTVRFTVISSDCPSSTDITVTSTRVFTTFPSSSTQPIATTQLPITSSSTEPIPSSTTIESLSQVTSIESSTPQPTTGAPATQPSPTPTPASTSEGRQNRPPQGGGGSPFDPPPVFVGSAAKISLEFSLVMGLVGMGLML